MRGRALLQQRGTVTQEIKQRSERLRELAKYRSPGDTVPTAESLASRGRRLEGAGRRPVGDLPRAAALGLAGAVPGGRGRGLLGHRRRIAIGVARHRVGHDVAGLRQDHVRLIAQR